MSWFFFWKKNEGGTPTPPTPAALDLGDGAFLVKEDGGLILL